MPETTITQIDVWRSAQTETQNLEFKEAKGSYDRDKLAKYCVAIANEGGGTLLLGIGDKPPRPVVGSAAFPKLVAAADELFVKIGFRVNIEERIRMAGWWSSTFLRAPRARHTISKANISCTRGNLCVRCRKTGFA